MAKLIVEFEWSDELGEDWFDMQCLELLMYGQAWTKREYLSATDLTDKGTFIPKKNYDDSEPMTWVR
jgi:hypothetical protein